MASSRLHKFNKSIDNFNNSCVKQYIKLQYPFAGSLQQELKAFYSSLDEEEKVKLKKYAETGALNLFSDGQFLDSLKVKFVLFVAILSVKHL